MSLVIATLSALGKMRKTGRAANLIKDEEGDKRAQLPHGTEGLRIGRVGSLGRSEMAVPAWHQGRGAKGFAGPQQSEPFAACVCTPFCIHLLPAGNEPAKPGVAKEPQKGGSPRSVYSMKPSWLVLCSTAELVGTGAFLHPARLGISQHRCAVLAAACSWTRCWPRRMEAWSFPMHFVPRRDVK